MDEWHPISSSIFRSTDIHVTVALRSIDIWQHIVNCHMATDRQTDGWVKKSLWYIHHSRRMPSHSGRQTYGQCVVIYDITHYLCRRPQLWNHAVISARHRDMHVSDSGDISTIYCRHCEIADCLCYTWRSACLWRRWLITVSVHIVNCNIACCLY